MALDSVFSEILDLDARSPRGRSPSPKASRPARPPSALAPPPTCPPAGSSAPNAQEDGTRLAAVRWIDPWTVRDNAMQKSKLGYGGTLKLKSRFAQKSSLGRSIEREDHAAAEGAPGQQDSWSWLQTAKAWGKPTSKAPHQAPAVPAAGNRFDARQSASRTRTSVRGGSGGGGGVSTGSRRDDAAPCDKVERKLYVSRENLARSSSSSRGNSARLGSSGSRPFSCMGGQRSSGVAGAKARTERPRQEQAVSARQQQLNQQLESEIRAAVQAEDYQLAADLKNQLERGAEGALESIDRKAGRQGSSARPRSSSAQKQSRCASLCLAVCVTV